MIDLFSVFGAFNVSIGNPKIGPYSFDEHDFDVIYGNITAIELGRHQYVYWAPEGRRISDWYIASIRVR